MAIFKKKGAGILDVIRCDEPSYLIWKWRPSGTELGETVRENAIRLGSHLRVNEGSVAAFFYKSRGDVDYIEGPYDQTIRTANMPVLSGIIGAFFKGDTPFQAEIYFINVAKEISIRFAVPFFDVYDHRFPDFGVPVAIRGTLHFKIADYKEFIGLHRLTDFSMEEFQGQVKDTVVRYVKNLVANASEKYEIPVVQLERQIDRISEIATDNISSAFRADFAIDVKRVDISDIEIDKSGTGYYELAAITKDITTATLRGQAAADIENYAETLRIQREEGQYAARKQTQTANFAAYQVEKQAEVGIAGAEALGHMGANNAGGVDLGGGGFNPAAMMAGMALGGAVGQNIAGTMGGIMSNINQPVNQGSVPPPIPQIAYHVAVNGQATGPYDINTLTQMAGNNTLTEDTLVWKSGMNSWQRADDVDELRNLFTSVPPIPTP